MSQVRKDPTDPAPTTAPGSIRKWLVQLLLPLTLGAGLLAGVVLIGRHLSARLQESGEQQVAFADIECTPPPGMKREDFLGEAQYLAGLPDSLNILDLAALQQISDALALHPWVARVRQVEMTSSGVVRAELEFRRPVLLVAKWTVDEEGILLPPQDQASRRKLPRLATKVPPPSKRSGKLWEDPAVQSAARVVGMLREELARRRGGSACVVEVQGGEVVLLLGRTRILWGRPPGQEPAGEAVPAIKARRLAEAGEPDGQEWDLRPESGLRRTTIDR